MSFRTKKGRAARLLQVEHLLYQNPGGLRPEEIAKLRGVSLRTVYRDFRALERELELQLWTDDDGRWGIQPGYHLPPVKFNLMEATALFLAACQASKYSDESRPHTQSAFHKLASVLRPPLSTHVQQTVEALQNRPPDPQRSHVMEILASAWADSCRVRLWYARDGEEPIARLVDPYSIEPSAIVRSCYLIGFCHLAGAIRALKMERIRQVEATKEKFVPPDDFQVAEYLRSSWSTISDREDVEVKLRFHPQAATHVKEEHWHPSQRIVEQTDGGLLFSVWVNGIAEVIPWVLSWGSDVQVLEPDSLVRHVRDIVHRQSKMYGVIPESAASV